MQPYRKSNRDPTGMIKSLWDTMGCKFIQCDNGYQDPSGIPVSRIPETVYEVLVELKFSY